MRYETETFLGYAHVDSGQLLIVDPCYVDEGFDYDVVCSAHSVGCDHSKDTAAQSEMFGGNEYHNGIGGPVLMGVVAGNWGGDGSFPVYAIQDGPGGQTIRLEVRFDEDGEEE